MEYLCDFATGNYPFLSGDETLEKAKRSCIELLEYRIKHHVKDVIGVDGDKKVWRLVLRDVVNKEASSLNVTNYDTILCSGCGDIPQEVSDNLKNIFVRLDEGLVLVKLQTEGHIYYVLSDSSKKNKVVYAASAAELERYGWILYISKDQDTPEAISCEIIKRCFGNNEKSCSNIDKRYIEMVRNGDVQKLETEIFEGDIKCASDEKGWTMLHHAAYHSNLEILSFLISIGCDVHAQDDICARKPVHIAAKEGHKDAIEFFLINGLSVNEADGIGWTLLHYAAWKGNLDAVRFLIQKKAQVIVQDKCLGKTPVYVATEEGHLEVVELLVSSGANIEKETNERVTPLHCAAYEGHLKVVEFLMAVGANPNAVDKDGWIPLHWAASAGHLNIVEFLVDGGANIYTVHGDGWTPLHCAACKGHLKVVEFLMDGGANPNAVNKDGWTPLHWAACEGHLKVVEFLVDREANINAVNEDGLTPLHCAVLEGHLNIIKFLVDVGANINGVDEDSLTPFYCAVHEGHLNIVKFLVDGGANLNAGDEDGSTPLNCVAGH